MRTLLTPVGAPLRTFSSTRNLVQALYSVVLHLERAYEAGILHRDVSEGNALLQESSPTKGFLLGLGTTQSSLPEGLVKFHEAFPDRVDDSNKYQAIPKSLKDLTGTPPFMAIEILKAYQNQQDSQSLNTDETGDVENGSVNAKWTDGAGTEGTCVGADAMEMIKDEDGVAKDAEVRGGDEQDVLATEIASTALTHSLRHDLESVYWLLVWMILRHTKHAASWRRYGMKNSWLAEVLRFYVAEQYPTERPFPLDPIRPTLPALYIPPITNSANNKAPQATQSLRRKIATDNLLSLAESATSAGSKRGRPIEEEPPVELVAAENWTETVEEGESSPRSVKGRRYRTRPDKEKQKAGAKSSKATGTKAQAKKQAPSTRGNNRTGSSNRKRKD
ncbi:hypothetical protein R3P38DRAFT_2966059 [Favolaschia claudopus]|uniref:Fungal-type protein kinase domain-containing protein n=1 Tax=Favolaschia claudopus TaxID=2862362 RepID=A0AAW0B5X0_9AGAR